MTDTSKQLGEHKHCCERIFYAMTRGQDALAVKVLRDELAKARAEERERVVGEIENLDIHSDSRCAELECSEDGYTNGLDDVVTILRE